MGARAGWSVLERGCQPAASLRKARGDGGQGPAPGHERPLASPRRAAEPVVQHPRHDHRWLKGGHRRSWRKASPGSRAPAHGQADVPSTALGWAGASLVVGPPRVRRRRRFSGDQLFISCFKGGDKFHCLISVIVIFNSLSSMFFLICWIFVACVHVCNPFYFLSALTYIL